MIRIPLMVPITALAWLPMGCHRSHQSIVPGPAEPTQSQFAGRSADDLWEAAQDALRRRGYRLDRVDREAGVITTLPETSQHYFEFWRHDVDTWADFWEATLDPMRRWVEVRVGTGGEVTVVVHKERLSSLDRQFNSTGAAFQYFGDSLPATTGKERVTTEDDRWVERGRDRAMERYILEQISKRLSEQPG